MSVKQMATLLVVRDLSASLSFYRDLLGFGVMGTYPAKPPYQWAMLQSGASQLQLQTVNSAAIDLPIVQREPLGGSFLIYLTVDNLDSVIQAMRGWSIPLMEAQEPNGGPREIAFRDPDGYLLVLTGSS